MSKFIALMDNNGNLVYERVENIDAVHQVEFGDNRSLKPNSAENCKTKLIIKGKSSNTRYDSDKTITYNYRYLFVQEDVETVMMRMGC